MQPLERKNEVVAEACVAAHVARFLAKRQRGKRLSDFVSYWKNGYEIDAVAHAAGELLGFEIKWSDREASFPFKVGPIKKLTYLSKGFFREKKPSVVPLALFLSML